MPKDLAKCPPEGAFPISDDLALLWLRQQQQPDAVLADMAAWRLAEGVAPGRLAAAWARLWASQPWLRLAFELGDDGALRAAPRDGLAPLHLLAAPDHTAAQRALHAVLRDPDTPLIGLALVAQPGATTLAILRHRLLTEAAPMGWLLATLTAAMDAQPAPAHPARGQSTPTAAATGAATTAPPPDWLRRDMSAPGGAPIRLHLPLRAPADANAVRAGLIALTGAAPALREAPVMDLALAAARGPLIAPIGPPPGFAAKPLLLPGLAPVEGLSLGLHSEPPGLELIAGADISPAGAAWVLERLAAGMTGGGLPPARSPAAPVIDEGPDLVALILAEFRAALDAPALGPQDDFFDHGGHSLLATRVIGRLLDRHGIEIAFEDIFAHASAARLASRARRGARTQAVPVPVPETSATDDEAPLSLAQQSLWKASAAFGHGAVFNLPFILRFQDPVDEGAFAAAFRDLMIRHPVLRSLFTGSGTEIRQRVVAPGALDGYRWFWTSAEAGAATAETEADHPFDLANELPLRLRFFRDDQRQVLSLLFHHIVIDEWSLNQVMAELARAYDARVRGLAPDWPDSPPPFHHFARDQRAAGGPGAHLDWWVDHLRGLPPPRPIIASPGPAQPEAMVAPPRRSMRLDLPGAQAEGLRRAARQMDASLFNVFHGAIGAALQSIAGLGELAVGTSASGRHAAAWFDTVGYFTTVVCHRLRFDPGMSLGALVAQSRDLVASSMPYTDIPIDLVEEALAGGAPVERDHIFEVFIQIHAGNALNGALPGPDGPIRFRQVEPETAPSILALHFEVMEDATTPGRDLHLSLNYRADRYDAAQAGAIMTRIGAVLARLAQPDGAATSLCTLGGPA